MTPAYEGTLVTVWQGDAREVLKTMKTESVDLVLTDPPYGVEWRSNIRAERFESMQNDGVDDRSKVRDVLRECVRLIGQNRHLYTFGPSDVLDGLKVSSIVELIWDKTNMGPGNLSSPWGPQHENISFTTSMHRHAGKMGNGTLPARLRRGSVLRYGRSRTGRGVRHPSEKPTDLLRELIESSSRQGEIVLDPFAGVGSVGVAAALLGRRAILVEIEPSYCSIAVERCATAEEMYRRSLTL